MATSRTGDETSLGVEEASQIESQGPKLKLGWWGDLRNFIHEVKLEMKKVSWPSRSEVINTTMVVIIAVFFFAFYLFGADIALSYGIQGIEWLALKLIG
jgi:preprotein translocase SecE subunit